VHLLRTAERGLFDFMFLAEGLRLRGHPGRIYDLGVVGRPTPSPCLMHWPESPTASD
jgi:alkanesulfonate monooxygenase SsuD/methylene tetrahydromethanopterin reductase-like flavin-dependent oxidoreductase (luciferase family)